MIKMNVNLLHMYLIDISLIVKVNIAGNWINCSYFFKKLPISFIMIFIYITEQGDSAPLSFKVLKVLSWCWSQKMNLLLNYFTIGFTQHPTCGKTHLFINEKMYFVTN